MYLYLLRLKKYLLDRIVVLATTNVKGEWLDLEKSQY